MKRALKRIGALLASRATTPVVIGIFLVVYIVLAFATDDTLTALMALTAGSLPLKALLALLPLSSAARLVKEVLSYLARRSVRTGARGEVPERLYDETVRVPAGPALDQLPERLKEQGYRTQASGGTLSAWRGIDPLWQRLLFLTATFCLYAGILISLTTRTSHRDTVIEGAPIPTSKGGGGVVDRINLAPSRGAVLANLLTFEVAPSEMGDPKAVLGLYPPSLYRGNFVYPRYLGLAPVVRFSAPDLGGVYQAPHPLTIYPAGKEEKAEIPGSPYRLDLSMAPAPDGSDPFVTGKITMNFKLVKGKELLFAGQAPVGGEFARDGYRIAFPSAPRMVITDFVSDYGVLLIWSSMALFCLWLLVWLPVRLFFPMREMGFVRRDREVLAYSRAEGRKRRHGGAFHEALDLFETKLAGERPSSGAPVAGGVP